MTDQLADARACLSRVDQAAAHFSAVSWLTATCEQIIAHLEAQQTEASLRRGLADITAGRTVDLGSFAQPETDPACRERWPECRQGGYDPACCRFPKSCSCDASPQPVTAPPAAQQGDSGHGDGYTPTTDEVEHRYAYDELYSMDCEADHHAFRRWLAAHDAEVRAQALREAASAPIPRAALSTRNGLRQWLRARADRIERGE